MKSNEDKVNEMEKQASKTVTESKAKDTKIKQLEDKLKDVEKDRPAGKTTETTGSLESRIKKTGGGE